MFNGTRGGRGRHTPDVAEKISIALGPTWITKRSSNVCSRIIAPLLVANHAMIWASALADIVKRVLASIPLVDVEFKADPSKSSAPE